MEKYIFILPSVLILMVFLNLNTVVAHGFPAMEECKVAEKATDQDIMNMRNRDQPKTKVQKCVVTCLGEKSGKVVYSIIFLVYINNVNIPIDKLNPDAVLNLIKSSPNYSAQLEQSVNELLAECKDITDPDRCESGAKIMDCLMDGATKRGIKGAFHGHKH